MMPRRAREKSSTGIYHIMLRGANRQEIFHEEEDNIRFLLILDKYTKESEATVLGWCLMDNHVHLLLREGIEDLSSTMKRIGVSFVWYYNNKYKTTGHLFQDRFKSERVEKDEYLLTVLRYIHQNPVKAGMVNKIEDWKWSSCLGYYGRDSFPKDLLAKDCILQMFYKDSSNAAILKFKEFNETVSHEICLDDELKVRLTDQEARAEILKRISEPEIAQVKSLAKPEKDRIFRKVKGIEGVSQRQVARILGVAPSLLSKA